MFEKKCTLKQLNSILVLVSIIPTLRLLSLDIVQGAKQSVWLLPILSAIVFIPLMIMQCYMIKKSGYKNYMQLNDAVYGKIIGRIITGIYMVWAIILSAYYIRLFAERISNTLFPYTDKLLFIGVMLFLCAYSIRMGATATFRTSSIFVIFVLSTIVISGIFLINQIDVTKLTPISSEESLSLITALIPFVSVLIYFILNWFFIDNIEQQPKQLLKYCFWTLAIIAIVQTIIIIIPVSMFGSELAFKMNSPFFESVKNINFFGAIEKIDAIVVVILILADFMIVLAFIFTALKALAHITEIKKIQRCSNIVLLLIALLTFSMATNYFNLKVVVKSVLIPGNVILGIVFPVILFIVGKIRKVFSSTSIQRS